MANVPVATAPVSEHASESIRFAPDILARLGEELVPHLDIGIVELVKNAFDADARNCAVYLEDIDRPGGTLRVADDGVGMDRDAIRDGWLVLGRSGKAQQARTPGGRVPAGDKGLGRLAALRLGRRVELETRPASRQGTAWRLALNWADYDAVKVVEEVQHPITVSPTDQAPGTDIVVKGLRRALGRPEVERLARALVLLNDPFVADNGFKVSLAGSGFAELEARVKDAYFDAADYHLVASLDAQGMAAFQAWDGSGRLLWSQAAHPGRPPYQTVEVSFEIWIFILEAKRFSPKNVTLSEVREWLKVTGGVHLYHQGMRVSPYGDSGHDWLDMNLARTRSPEERPSTGTTIGRVQVVDPQGRLRQKTDRSGFIEDQAFLDLRRFAQDALEWLAGCRLKEKEGVRRKSREGAPRELKAARRELKRALEVLPSAEATRLNEAIAAVERAQQQQIAALSEDVQLYRTLATVGVTTSVFAHETDKAVHSISSLADSVELRAKLANMWEKVQDPVTIIRRHAMALAAWTSLPLSLLERKKRSRGPLDLNQCTRELVRQLRLYFDEAGVPVALELSEGQLSIIATVAEVEAVLANLLVNALKALQVPEVRSRPREIRVQTERLSSVALLRVLDSGGGIQGIGLDDIWLPGRTAFPEGSGLGLTIVRDICQDLGGRVWAEPQGELGGATFVVEFPIYREM